MKKGVIWGLFLIWTALIFAEGYTPDYKYGIADLYPKKFEPNGSVTVYYFAKKSKEIINERKKKIKKKMDISLYPEKIYIHFGFNNWEKELTIAEGLEPEMEYDSANDCWKYNLSVPPAVKEVNITFKDELNNWDNNLGRDYKFSVEGDNEPPKKLMLAKIIPAAGDTYIEWGQATDKDLSGYIVYRNGNKMTEVPIKENCFLDTNTSFGEDYSYKIKAIDTNRNESEPLEIKVKAAKNVIVLPEIDVITGVISNSRVKLVATLDDIYSWKVEIISCDAAIVKTFNGKSNIVNLFWDFKNELGELVSAGNYKYMVTVDTNEAILPREMALRLID